MTVTKSDAKEILRLKTALELPAVKKFAVADTIEIGKHLGGRPITFVGENFLRHFRDVTEENVPAEKICFWTLVKWSNDPPIIEALGGEVNAETHLTRMVQEIRLREEGPGYFRNDVWSGIPNLRYKRSPADGNMYVVYWNERSQKDGGGLGFDAQPITRTGRWMDGIPVCGGSEQSPLTCKSWTPPKEYPFAIVHRDKG